MRIDQSRPIIVQSDRTVLLEFNNAEYEAARDALARFAELEKSPEHIHTYRISPLSLWNAAASGLAPLAIVEALTRYGKYELPANIRTDIFDYIGRYGRLKLYRESGALLLVSDDPVLITEITHHKRFIGLFAEQRDERTLVIDPALRGQIKQALVHFGFPAEDLAGYVNGAPLAIALRGTTAGGSTLRLRAYQQEAVDVFYASGGARGGSGVIVLPCGAGKTLVGLGVMDRLRCATLILTPNTVAARQWISEIVDKTDISPDLV